MSKDRQLWLSCLAWLCLCFGVQNGVSQHRCLGAFDIYFVLDKSSSVPIINFQAQTVNFVVNITNSFISPQLRISFITFSNANATEVVLGLTSNRSLIAKGLNDLRRVNPKGRTYMANGIKKATDQIKTLGHQTASFILTVTDGQLNDFAESVKQADIARTLGAWVLAVGVANYQEDELVQLANKPSSDFVFTETNFDALKNLIDVIVEKSCIEILSASPTVVCIGANYSVTLRGRGFNKTEDTENVICSFRYNNTYREVQKPTRVEPTRLDCPGFMFEKTERDIVLQVSVNKGLTFVSSNVTLSSRDCSEPTEALPRERRRSNIGLAVFLILFFLFLIALLLWWFWPLICKQAPPKYQPAAAVEAPPRPPPPQQKGPVKGKWPTVDASYYGGGGVGGIAPVRVEWGDKGSTEAGSKLAKAKGATSKNPADDKEELTGGRGGGRGGRGGASSPGCMEIARAKWAGCVAAMSRGVDTISAGYHRMAAHRPRPGGNLCYSQSPAGQPNHVSA